MMHIKNRLTYPARKHPPATSVNRRPTPANLILAILGHLRHLICLLLLLTPFPLHAATDVSGHIGADATWTKAGSPYIVTGNVSVYGDATTGPTLTIDPGVEVRFNPSTKLLIGSGKNKGALVAQGTASEPIVFTANTDNPGRGNWRGIYFEDGTMDETTVMEHCVIECGDRNTISSASLAIRDCVIREMNQGIYCTSSTLAIENTTISNTSEASGTSICKLVGIVICCLYYTFYTMLSRIDSV